MQEVLDKILAMAKMEILAPAGGGGIGIFAWAIQLAPVISIVAALTGIFLGIMSYRLKRKLAKIEADYYAARINSYKSNSK